jgi:glycosyltransferase involved in cell wall biosynthesis
VTVVSVVIPVRNGAHMIEASVASVLAQENVGPLQVIVVDNGSTDQTMAFVRERFGKRVTLLEELTPGAAAARNAGLARAHGDFLAFLDADDLWLPGKLAAQMTRLAQDPSVDMVFCFGEEFSDPHGAHRVRTAPFAMMGPSGFLARRAVAELTGPLPLLRAGEFIAWYAWARELGFSTAVLKDNFVRRRVHSANTTRNSDARRDYAEAMHWQIQMRRQRAAQVGAS